jgi:hypothetical protein
MKYDFGDSERGFWLTSKEPTNFFDALGRGYRGETTLYIYNNHGELIYVIPDIKKIFKKITTELHKTHKVKSKYNHLSSQGDLHWCLNQIKVKKASKFNEAIQFVEAQLIKKAEYLRNAYGHHKELVS